ncbi:transposase [Paraburkholderia panacisoli]|uniref:transposase n=1 Tax=Paraburkholderia panacisoli TaxID=2603818 RepID=UPI003CCC5E28
MGKHRTPYPAEFRAQMVELVKAGRRPEELEKEFEPTAQTIYNWVTQADRDTGGIPVNGSSAPTWHGLIGPGSRRLTCKHKRPESHSGSGLFSGQKVRQKHASR